MKEPEDFLNRKEQNRKKKIKDKSCRKTNDYEDPIERKANKNNTIKKIREEIKEEEWEDWDRYYNH
jgi:hypothetical protein